MGQTMSATQFFLYGKRNFTSSGYLRHAAGYADPRSVDRADLRGRSYVVTGANSGIGKEITRYLATQGARVYMVCRNRNRCHVARGEIAAAAGCDESNLVPIIGDCGLKRDVEQVVREIELTESNGVDGLVCNAGCLLNERTETSEGVETTFAVHFLCGTYHLTNMLRPSLERAAEAGRSPRVVLLSSGGMYCSRVPSWGTLTSTTEPEKYDGQLAYAFAKRAQVLLAERLASRDLAGVEYVSAHPGWTATSGVEQSYGDKAKYLEPLRSLWQGAEGICWLLGAARAEQIKGGAFYLDRAPQVKHMAGPFFSEGTFTKNKEEEVDDLLANCDQLLRSL